MNPTIKVSVRHTINALAPGFRVERAINVPANHRVPGLPYVVMGPNITGGPGEGSYGSGRTPQEAIDMAALLSRGY